ncbi:MAG TPA: AMP-binding protein, partial [Acidimicrobiales bacterium]|nr:AMP-binding protein [Acidimicrobiales bacterium]
MVTGTSGEWALAAVHDVVSAAAPDREMVVCGDVRRTYAEVADRSRSLAAFLVARGIGLRHERSELERWESGQAAVALVLHNCAEYLEAMYGAFRARAVPFNVNQHYRPAEVGALLADVDVRAVIYQRALGPLVAAAYDTAGLVLVDVDDGSGVEPLPGSTGFETAVATPVDAALPTPSPDDLYMVCTGGTTGSPKAVLWRQADVYVAAMRGEEGITAASIAAAAERGAGAWYATPPLMHAAAQWTAFSGLHLGATVVLHDDARPFDAPRILEVAEREKVVLMSIVGDAYAARLVEELRRRRYDLSSLSVLATGGAATGEQHKDALLELLPHLTIIDGYGSSETGGMAFGTRSRDQRPEAFSPGAGAAVVSADLRRFLEPGEEEVGWTARRGRVPLGYLHDRGRTAETFPVIGGERVSIPGDRAQLLADGTIRMLGRDSMVVNTGGEKVFVEEVETVLRNHPDVEDALVVGRPSDRFGQEVVAIVAPRRGTTLDPVALREFVAADIARFKAP